MQRIKDFWFRFGEPIKTFLKIFASLASVLVVMGLIFGWFNPVSKEEEQQMLDELKDKYEVLSSYEAGQNDKPGIRMSISLKDPFTSFEEMEKIAEYIVEQEKVKVKEETGEKLRAVEILIYTREIVYDQDLNPRGTVHYQHKDGWVPSFEKGLKGYRNHKYEIVYPAMVTFEGVEYLTDEEYEIFLRIMEFKELRGTDNAAGIELYLIYDKKVDRTSDEYHVKFREMDELVRRAYSYGEPNNMFEGSGEYLLEYYKEANPELYKFVTEY